jgi:hypothetical protein
MGNRSNILLVGNTTTAQNLGGGSAEIYIGKNNGNNLQFRTISATGSSIQIYQVDNKILIGGGGGTGGTSYNFISSGATIVTTVGNNIIIYSPTGGTGSGTITGGTNGLSVSGKNIKLGGTLTGETTINGAQTLNINQTILNLSGNTCVNITGNVKLLTTPANGASSTTGLVWDTGTTQIKGVPVINEWVCSESQLCYTGQKFAYPTHSIFQVDVGSCVAIPNYIFIQNICLKTVGDTLAFTIPACKTALLNRAKLIILNDASPTSFSISIGNNACYIGNCSNNNLANLQTINNVLTNETYELDLSTKHQGVPAASGANVYFRVGSGSTSACNLCAHLLLEGFLY